jgi:dTDP-4-dehydrorhamnose reductase
VQLVRVRQAIFEPSEFEVNLIPWSSAETANRARRPAYSVLANDGLRKLGLAQIRDWKYGLADYVERRRRSGAYREHLAGVNA